MRPQAQTKTTEAKRLNAEKVVVNIALLFAFAVDLTISGAANWPARKAQAKTQRFFNVSALGKPNASTVISTQRSMLS
jgi:hypothetical protein